MAVSILEIDVKDEAFKKFRAEFLLYQDQLSKMPGTWGKVKQQIDAATAAQKKLQDDIMSPSGSRPAVSGRPLPPGVAFKSPLPGYKLPPGVTWKSSSGGLPLGAMPRASTPGAGAPGAPGGPNGPGQPPGAPGLPPGAAPPGGGVPPTSAHRQSTLMLERFGRAALAADRSMMNMAKSSVAIAKHVAETTYNLAKWAAMAVLGAGLLGGGGLFGLDRLANSTGSRRRSAQGLGVSSGEAQSFDLNYSRFFDTSSVMENIANAKNNPADRWAFSSMGVDNVEKRNPAELGVEMAIKAKKIFEEGGQNQQYAEARGLTKFFTLDDLRRLHEMSVQELEDQRKKYYADRQTLQLTDETQKKWQDLSTQLNRAGLTIETILIKKLVTLAEPLGNLSDAFTKAIEKLLDSDRLTVWINNLGRGITWLADYLISPAFSKTLSDFEDNIGTFVTNVMNLGRIIFNVVSKINAFLGVDDKEAAKHWYSDPFTMFGTGGTDKDQAFSSWYTKHILGGDTRVPHGPGGMGANDNEERANNVGNLRVPGSTIDFQKFATQAEGVNAMVSQLRLYQNRDKLDTISGIVNKYAPPSENDTGAYIKNVSDWTGFKSDQKLNMNDDLVASKVVAAMTRQEGTAVNQMRVLVDIQNATGANVAVTSNAAAVAR